MTEYMVSAGRVMETYAGWLARVSPKHHQEFKKRLGSNPGGAEAEAVVFSWLRPRHNPKLCEDPGEGGPDFACETKWGKKVVVEVTALNPEAIEERTEWPNDPDHAGGAFKLITEALQGGAKDKAEQLGGQAVPGVLVICLRHIGASALMGTYAARLFSIDPKLAPFYKPRTEGGYEPARRSISAILLAAVYEMQIEIVGLLHPVPVRPLDIEIFYDVPFFRVKWPITGQDVEGEWITAHPSPSKDQYVSVELTEDEKKSVK